MKILDNRQWITAKKIHKKNDSTWTEVANIKANFGSDGWHEIVPPNAIILYDLANGSLPSTATLCNGNGGTHNLLNRYVMMTTNTSKVFSIGGSDSHTGASHGAANGNNGETDSASPQWQPINKLNGGTNQSGVNENQDNTAHTHSGIASHTHPDTASNHRRRKRLQPTMYDDIIRTNAVFLHTNGAFDGILELIVYGGFLELADNNIGYLTEGDNVAFHHTHGTYTGTTNSYTLPNDTVWGSNHAGTTRYSPKHTHKYTHSAFPAMSYYDGGYDNISFPNQSFYTGKTTRKTYWDELPPGTVCLFINDLMPKGWAKLATVKKYSNGVVSTEVSTENMMIYMKNNVGSNTTAPTTHNHEGFLRTTVGQETFSGPPNERVSSEFLTLEHSHTFPDNHSTMVDHRPPYIQLYIGYKVPPTYTVSFNANGGSGSQSSIVKTYNISLTMPTCTFSKAGYKLKNWNTRADGNGTAYTEGSSTFNTNANTTLYAIWEVDNTASIKTGSYTPTTFENEIKKFISQGGSRTVKNSFTATVNNQTITVPAGATIYYLTGTAASSTVTTRLVGFGSYTSEPFSIASSTGFTNYKTYCVYGGNSSELGAYSSFYITIGGNDIVFN